MCTYCQINLFTTFTHSPTQRNPTLHKVSKESTQARGHSRLYLYPTCGIKIKLYTRPASGYMYACGTTNVTRVSP